MSIIEKFIETERRLVIILGYSGIYVCGGGRGSSIWEKRELITIEPKVLLGMIKCSENGYWRIIQL